MAYKFLVENKESSAAPPQKEYVFIVEGEDDGVFLEHLLSLKGEDPSKIEVQYVKGIAKIAPYLSALAKSPPLTSGAIKKICIIVDADTNFESAQQSANSWLRDAGLPAAESGKIENNGSIEVGLYLLPNSKETGELEDLIISSLSSDERISSAIEMVDRFNDKSSPFKKKPKRILQVALAVSSTDLCAGAGRGIRNGAFSIDLNSVSDLDKFLTDFLRR